jgi:2-polyprenyl-6-methoxyphenol hydroxylase-like FAD-dependent oxidoreductase
MSNEHAVILGAGMAGLLTAAALAEQFAQVTIVERDTLPANAVARRGVPQGRHLHSLLSGGSQALESLVPGILAELADAGAVVVDGADLAEVLFRTGLHTFNRTDPVADPAALTTFQASRPFLEHHLRRRVEALPNVHRVDGCEAVNLIAAQSNRVAGVRVVDRGTNVPGALDADLVVDATGRASRTPALLERLGYRRPPQQSWRTDGVYFSQRFTLPEPHRVAEKLILVLPDDGRSRGGLVANEHGSWTLTISSHAASGTTAPRDLRDMLALAADFLPRRVLGALGEAVPLGAVSVMRYPGGTWHRYDQVTDMPDGLLVVGDALCSLDPIHGQGMTLAARHAVTLRDQLRATGTVAPAAFYRSTAKLTAAVWAMNAAPEMSDRRRRMQAWLRARILDAAADDIAITEQLLRVTNFVDPPRRMRRPDLLRRVAAFHVEVAIRRKTVQLRRTRAYRRYRAAHVASGGAR